MPLPKAKDVAVRLYGPASSMIAKTVRVPAGGQTLTIGKGSDVVAGSGFDVAATGSQLVWLAPGESLWGICASGKETTYELL